MSGWIGGRDLVLQRCVNLMRPSGSPKWHYRCTFDREWEGTMRATQDGADVEPKDRPSGGTRILACLTKSTRNDRLTEALHSAQHEVAEAGSIDELLVALEQTEPNVVVIGRGCSSRLVWLVSQVVELAPQSAVVVLFDRPDDAELLAVIHAGALGYLPTTIPPERLVIAVEAVRGGEPALPRSMTISLFRQLRSPGHITLPSGEDQPLVLSEREWDVLCLLKQGYTTNQIAEQLYVCSATVRSHVSAVVHKLDVSDRDAALEAVFSR